MAADGSAGAAWATPVRGGAARVDAVITWVDGSDPAWRQRRQYHAAGAGLADLLATANVEGRFRARGELRYLLRSLAAFWPFAGRIFVLTDGQRPAWLHAAPPIVVLDHRDFIEARHLPTFSSRAIEASMHRIPGLAEHFVSFNDDFFLTRPVGFEDFFADGGGCFHLGGERTPARIDAHARSAENDAFHARAWMRRHYGHAHLDRLPAHCPRGLRKSRLSAMERQHPALFEAVRAERFRRRGGQSIVANLYPDWSLAHGEGEARASESLYLTTDALEADAGAVRSALQACLGHGLSACINDTTDDREDLRLLERSYRSIMEELFPQAAAWEQDGAAGRPEHAVAGAVAGAGPEVPGVAPGRLQHA